MINFCIFKSMIIFIFYVTAFLFCPASVIFYHENSFSCLDFLLILRLVRGAVECICCYNNYN